MTKKTCMGTAHEMKGAKNPSIVYMCRVHRCLSKSWVELFRQSDNSRRHEETAAGPWSHQAKGFKPQISLEFVHAQLPAPDDVSDLARCLGRSAAIIIRDHVELPSIQVPYHEPLHTAHCRMVCP